MNETEVFDGETFKETLASAKRIRGEIYESATNNKKSSRLVKKGFDRCHLSSSEINM